jgi:hypothetical protein
MRRIGFLITLNADDPGVQERVTLFVQGLQQLGWTDVVTLRSTYDRVRPIATAFVRLQRNWLLWRQMCW